MDKELIKKIEIIFDIKLYDWQVAYLKNEPIVLDIKTTGRCQGKTFAYIIKKIFESKDILDLSTIEKVLKESDWWSINRRPQEVRCNYEHFFLREFKKIYEEIARNGIEVREVLFKKSEVKEFYSKEIKDTERTYY